MHRILKVSSMDNEDIIRHDDSRMIRTAWAICRVMCNKPTEAVSLFSRAPERFDALIVDEIMPDLRGTELAAELVLIKNDISIILMTGHGSMISLEMIRKSCVKATLIRARAKGTASKGSDRTVNLAETRA